jgi:hypothetical protein
MPQSDHFEDETDDYRDDQRSAHPRGTRNPAMVVGLVAGAALLVGLLVCGGLAFLYRAAPAGPPVAQQTPTPQLAAEDAAVTPPKGGGAATKAAKDGTKRVYTREEFRKAVIGKSKREVLTLLGEPDLTVFPDGPAGAEPREVGAPAKDAGLPNWLDADTWVYRGIRLSDADAGRAAYVKFRGAEAIDAGPEWFSR